MVVELSSVVFIMMFNLTLEHKNRVRPDRR